MSDLKVKFGKRLRKLRRNMDLTQEELAERVGVSSNFIGQVERGTNAPSFDVLAKLAEVLEVEVEEFFQFPKEK